ncbi:MAG: hypothetical protein QM754_01480 [Tepidisphaeraceae bacterium]
MSTVSSTQPPLTEAAADTKPRRRGVNMPAWLAILIVVVVTAGAGYAGWKLLAPAPQVDLTQYETNERRGNANGVRNRPNNGGNARQNNAVPAMVEGVELKPDGTGVAQTNGFSVRFMGSPKQTLVPMSRIGEAAQDDLKALRARTQAINDSGARTAVGITDDQVAKLRAATLTQPPLVDRPRQAKLLDLWAKLRAAAAADRPAAEKAVMDAVRDAEASYRTARTAAYRAHADAVRTVLKPEQIDKLAQR